MMALVSGGRSTLNPNAPLFVPAAVRQVEDFSPDWWNLVTTSTWFRDYWISQHQGEDIFADVVEDNDDDDIVGLLPDTIDLCVDEEILNMEEQFEEFLKSSEAEHVNKSVKGLMENGYGKDVNAIVKSLNMANGRAKSPREAMRYWEKPAKHVSPMCSPRFIHQPR